MSDSEAARDHDVPAGDGKAAHPTDTVRDLVTDLGPHHLPPALRWDVNRRRPRA